MKGDLSEDRAPSRAARRLYVPAGLADAGAVPVRDETETDLRRWGRTDGRRHRLPLDGGPVSAAAPRPWAARLPVSATIAPQRRGRHGVLQPSHWTRHCPVSWGVLAPVMSKTGSYSLHTCLWRRAAVPSRLTCHARRSGADRKDECLGALAQARSLAYPD